MKLDAKELLWIIMRRVTLCPPMVPILGYLFRFAWDRNGVGPLEREHFYALAVTPCIIWVLGYFSRDRSGGSSWFANFFVLVIRILTLWLEKAKNRISSLRLSKSWFCTNLENLIIIARSFMDK